MTVIPHSVTHMFISQQTYDRHHQYSEYWIFVFSKLQLVSNPNLQIQMENRIKIWLHVHKRPHMDLNHKNIRQKENWSVNT